MRRTQKYGHVMVDLETMGNNPYSAIVSIGAVEFNLDTGEIGEKFYQTVSLQSCLDAGLIVNADTIMWWMQQSDDARKELSTNCVDLAVALQKFSQFMFQCEGEYCQVWGNSARFDLGILSDAYRKCSLATPWSFRNERCVRTLVSFNPELRKKSTFVGTQHNALHDCLHQIQYCNTIANSIKLKI